jgi:hypothetical protein
MADTKKKAGDLGQSEVQDAFNKAQEQGFFGQKVDPLPNSAHSLESGPDAPTIQEQAAAAAEAQAQAPGAGENADTGKGA